MRIGECGDASSLPGTADELFQIAALLMGSGGAGLALVEETLASLEIDPCQDPETARQFARRQVLVQGARQLRTLDPAGFHAPQASTASGSGCVQDDDLTAAGISHAQLNRWLAGGGREDVRKWLAALPPVQRLIFVDRAVLGEGNAETALVLDGEQGSDGTHWTPDAVGDVYRQVLCSLANSLAHAPAVVANAAAHGSSSANSAQI
jgi:DNA-directed RNA polymerase specialized sigma24 family protein